MGAELELLLHPLTVDLQEAVVADASNGNACPVHRHGGTQCFFHLAVVATLAHIDEIDHQQATDIPKT